MLEFENTVLINCSIKEVFNFLANFENIPKWNYFVQVVKKTSLGDVGVGTTYHQVRKTDEQSFSIIEFEPNTTLAIETLPGETPYLKMVFNLQSENGGTLVRDTWRLDTGKPALLEKLAGNKVKMAVAENLNKLKQLLEEGNVILQDGRRQIL